MRLATRLATLAACLLASVLTGCTAGVVATLPEPVARPSSGPAISRESRLMTSAMVIDAGRGPQLCLGAVLQALPPQCGSGTPLVGWKWPAGSEERAGVRFGNFAVVGTFDGKRFHVEKTIDDSEYAAAAQPQTEVDFGSRCTAPQGGWRAPDPARATQADQDRVLTAAEDLPGYGGTWIDDQGHDAQDPVDVVINVQVTGDVDGATRTLRELWGGSLCVSHATYTATQLLTAAAALGKRPGVLSSAPTIGLVELGVRYDDGTLQRELDDRYGTGLVRVTSALQPYPG